jgi:hypothetical protein
MAKGPRKFTDVKVLVPDHVRQAVIDLYFTEGRTSQSISRQLRIGVRETEAVLLQHHQAAVKEAFDRGYKHGVADRYMESGRRQ